jgi:hypothetical protein
VTGPQGGRRGKTASECGRSVGAKSRSFQVCGYYITVVLPRRRQQGAHAYFLVVSHQQQLRGYTLIYRQNTTHLHPDPISMQLSTGNCRDGERIMTVTLARLMCYALSLQVMRTRVRLQDYKVGRNIRHNIITAFASS